MQYDAHARGCTPRPGCSAATPDSTRPTSARRTSRQSALLDGVEWNVRSSQVATPSLLDKFHATFDTYWNAPSSSRTTRIATGIGSTMPCGGQGHGPARPGDHHARRARGPALLLPAGDARRARASSASVHDRHRNLVVAATGTGKTVIAALDYRELGSGSRHSRPRLLFVAHRSEILEQSLRTYREVLADGDFGELYVGGARPERWKHVFASVQSLTSYGVANIPRTPTTSWSSTSSTTPRRQTYRRILDHLHPRGAARPHRHPGARRRHGRPRVLRRPHRRRAAPVGRARALTCSARSTTSASPTAPTCGGSPGVAGGTTRPQLSNVYTGNDARARIVLNQLRDKVADVGRDARTRLLRQRRPRRVHGARLQRGRHPGAGGQRHDAARPSGARACATCGPPRSTSLFTVDLFNEGLDLPDVDTVLFLAAHRERDDLPAAARSRTSPHAATRPC